jgi:hypothetical protein
MRKMFKNIENLLVFNKKGIGPIAAGAIVFCVIAVIAIVSHVDRAKNHDEPKRDRSEIHQIAEENKQEALKESEERKQALAQQSENTLAQMEADSAAKIEENQSKHEELKQEHSTGQVVSSASGGTFQISSIGNGTYSLAVLDDNGQYVAAITLQRDINSMQVYSTAPGEYYIQYSDGTMQQGTFQVFGSFDAYGQLMGDVVMDSPTSDGRYMDDTIRARITEGVESCIAMQ